ncbi:uncharacterized protein [Heterodontus francisci]
MILLQTMEMFIQCTWADRKCPTRENHSVQPTGSILRTLLKQFFGHFSYMKENMRVEARCNFRQLQDWKSKMLLSEMYHSAVTSLKMASHPLPHHGNALKTVNLLYLCGPRCPLQDATVISKSSIMPCAKFKNVNRQAHVEPTADTIQLTPTENYSPLLLKRVFMTVKKICVTRTQHSEQPGLVNS